ncbi:hypothetical protein HDU76_010692 [Blyttiomyces sp. JEL0837]|nr:hypothetical protein HDU76_010692 [Blyttiomyces sp. JEL0837]
MASTTSATEAANKNALSRVASLPGKVISHLVETLRDHPDHVSMLLVCKGWSKPVAEAMYRAPPLQSPDSFERLMGLLNTPLPYHPYPAMIRELDISGMAADNLYMGDLDAALGMCPNLEVFRLENCYHISNILIQSIAHHCPNLLQLDLPGCPVSDSFMPLLTKKCRHLLRLDMSFTNASIASIHPVILNSESLLELDLSECREAEDLTALDLSNKGFRRPLKSLSLRNTPVTDDLLRYAVSQCPELEIVVLESCPRITDDAVIKLISTCTRLRSIDLSFCDRITDLSLNALGARGDSSVLEELYLSACDLISPVAVQQMVQKIAGKLELLVLDGCERILGSFVQALSTTKGDELECTLERDAVRALASWVAPAAGAGGSMVTPPASPARPVDVTGGLKFEVSYVTTDDSRRKKANTGFAAAIIRSVVAPGEAVAAIAAAKGESVNNNNDPFMAGGSPQSLRKKSSRTLRHRRSLLGLSQRMEDEEDAIEAAKYERQEKIKEKRRSRTSSNTYDQYDNSSISRGAGASSPSAVLSPTSPATPPVDVVDSVAGAGVVAEPASVDDDTAKAAFFAKAAARGVKIGAPGETPVATTTPSGPSKRGSTSSLKATVPEFVPSTPVAPVAQPAGPQGTWGAGVPVAAAPGAAPVVGAPVRRPSSSADPWAQAPPSVVAATAAGVTPLASGKPLRRPSTGQPSGPPGPGSSTWTTPAGIAPSGVVGGAAAPGTPVTPVAAAGTPTPSGDGILLFSGRAARAASISKESAPEMAAAVAATTVATPEPGAAPAGADGENPVLIASGRRRTRGNSVTEDIRNAGIPVAGTPEPGAVGPNGVPTWINAPPSTPVTPAQMPWGTDPKVWNNPAQLTSSSSTWSTTSGPQQTFVDPWSKAPVPSSSILGPSNVINTNDPWAAAPPKSNLSSAVTPPIIPPAAVAPVAPLPFSGAADASSAAAPSTPAPVAPSNWTPTPVAPTLSPSLRMAASSGWTPATAGAAGSNAGAVAASAGNWGPSVPPVTPPTSTPGSPSGMKTPRPSSVSSARFGSVGVGAAGGAGTGNLANGAAARASWAPGAKAGIVGAAANKEAPVDGGFVFSNPKRGRMLLKLKIETKAGGHQTLSVHEFDDPQQLASEFVAYWDMQAFKEPLVRLITVRKNNVLRSRAH